MTAPARPRRALPNYVYRVLEVLRTERLSPHLLRLTLGGDELAGFATDRQGPNIKLYVPRPGQARPEMPAPDGKGNLLWPPDDRRPTMRTYTVRRYDAERGELDVDVVVHGDHGVAGPWAAAARPGDLIGVTGPGGKSLHSAEHTVLVADLAGAPAIATLLEGLPADAHGTAVLGVPTPADEPPLTRPAGVGLRVVTTPDDDESALIAEVQGLERPAGSVFAWVAAESETVRSLREHFREGWGLGREDMLCTGYWKRGLSETDYDLRFRNDRADHDRRADG